MKTLHLASTLAALCGLAMFAAPALAQTASPQPANQPANTTVVAATATTTKRAVPPPDSRNCIRDTGSHIPPPKGQCLPVPGNSYSQQDIQRTGAANVGQALQMLDPSVTVRGGGH